MRDLLGWKNSTKKSAKTCQALFGEPIAPNLADLGSKASMHFAGYAYETLDVPRSQIRNQSLDDEESNDATGTALERAIEQVDAGTMHTERIGGHFSWINGWFTNVGGIALIAGIICFALFVANNVPK